MADDQNAPPGQSSTRSNVALPGIDQPEEQNDEDVQNEPQQPDDGELPLASVNDATKGLLTDESFHGIVPIEDLSQLLKQNGDYLLRSSDSDGAEGRRIVASVMWNGKIHTAEVMGSAQGVSFDNKCFNSSVLELVDFHRKHGIPVNAEGAKFVKAVKRQEWELRRDDLEINDKLGEGAFGEVRQGKLKIMGRVVDVAVKIPKQRGMEKDTIAEAMKEARIQKDYVHPNVVRLYGVAAESDPFMIVLEFVGGGSLDQYLKRYQNDLSVDHLAMMCFDVTCGLDYLHSKECIHRDIAARNCLFCSRYGIVKISDFGLSSVGNVQMVDRTKPAPIRWLAPEVLKTACYTKTADVWSLGIVYWEIFTCAAEMPFKSFTLAEVQRRLCSQTDFHPTMPAKCPADIRNLALRCWEAEPSKRLTANLLTMKLMRYANWHRYEKIPGLKVPNRRVKKTKPKSTGPQQQQPPKAGSRDAFAPAPPSAPSRHKSSTSKKQVAAQHSRQRIQQRGRSIKDPHQQPQQQQKRNSKKPTKQSSRPVGKSSKKR